MRLLLLAIQSLLLALPLPAEDSFSRFIEDSVLKKLRAGQTISASMQGKGTLSLLPAMSSREAIREDVKNGDPTVCVEMIRILGGLPGPLDASAGWLRIFNTFHAVSKMKGMTYWSTTHKQVRVLFTKSYAVESPERPAPIPDSLFSAVPLDDQLYTFQEDLTFGKNLYQASLFSRGDHFREKIENLSTISYAFIPVIQPRNFVSHIVLIPAGSDLLFYGVSYIHTSIPLGDRRSREESLFNRLVALSNWLKTRLEASSSP